MLTSCVADYLPSSSPEDWKESVLIFCVPMAHKKQEHFLMSMYGEAWLLSLLEDRMFVLLGSCRVLRAVKPPVFFLHLSKHPCM